MDPFFKGREKKNEKKLTMCTLRSVNTIIRFRINHSLKHFHVPINMLPTLDKTARNAAKSIDEPEFLHFGGLS